MKREFFASVHAIKKLVWVICSSTVLCVHAQPKADRPNIVFILADDLGWMDLTINGSRYYDTPNIDKLAKRGMLFSNAYTANPLCSPTRASILSGQYPARLRFTLPLGHLPPRPDTPLLETKANPWQKVITPASRTHMPLETVTLAEQLKTAGYTTGFIGKWHLGRPPFSPENQGFKVNVAGGPHPGPPSYYAPYKIANLPDGPANEYITDRISDEAATYIAANKDTTFFLCVWHFAVHGPFQAKRRYVAEYENKTDPRGRQGNPIMAAMIKSLDESVGHIMHQLDSLGLTDNTLLVFTSDNGGNMYTLINGKDATNNYPLSYGKGNIHEGGVRVPLIVSWPREISPGSRSEALVNSVDFYPTLLEAASVKPDAGYKADGSSIMPALKGHPLPKQKAVYVHFPHYIVATDNYPATSVRLGDWKLIKFYGEGPGQGDTYKLYHLKKDLGEKHNLADKMPGKVNRLAKLIDQHLKDVDGVVPVVNPGYRPDAKSNMGTKNIFPMERYKAY